MNGAYRTEDASASVVSAFYVLLCVFYCPWNKAVCVVVLGGAGAFVAMHRRVKTTLLGVYYILLYRCLLLLCMAGAEMVIITKKNSMNTAPPHPPSEEHCVMSYHWPA